jgi:hypothetical protein
VLGSAMPFEAAAASARHKLTERVQVSWQDCRDRVHVWLGGQPRAFLARDVLPLLQEPGCPVCNSVKNHDERFFFWLFAEHYRKLSFLARFADGLGFCPDHAAVLMRREGVHSQLRLMHEFGAARWLAALADSTGKGVFQARGCCPVCESRRDAMARAAFQLSGLLHMPSERGRYGSPSRLCFPHLQQVVAGARTETSGWLLDLHLAWTEAAIRELCGRHAEDPPGKSMAYALALAAGEDPQLALGPWLGTQTAGQNGERMQPPPQRLASWLPDEIACPVCREVGQTCTVRHMAAAGENGTVREEVLPLCPQHAWFVARPGSPKLAVAVTNRALRASSSALSVALNQLRQPSALTVRVPWTGLYASVSRHRRLRAAREVLALRATCPQCVLLRETVDSTLRLLFALLGKRHHRGAYEQGHGLCLQHLVRACQLQPDRAAGEYLVRAMTADLRLLHWELEDVVRRSGWEVRSGGQPLDDSGLAAKALRRFSGTAGP